MTDHTHHPDALSWVASAAFEATDFPIQNLPFGVFRRRGSDEVPRVGVAIGDLIPTSGPAPGRDSSPVPLRPPLTIATRRRSMR